MALLVQQVEEADDGDENNSQNNNTTGPDDVMREWKLEWSGLLAGVMKDIHHKLDRMSHSQLGHLEGHDSAIHCSLCKPKAIHEITVRILGMSASKFVVQKLLVNATQCLPLIAEDVHDQIGIGGRCSKDDVLQLGQALLKEMKLDSDQKVSPGTLS